MSLVGDNLCLDIKELLNDQVLMPVDLDRQNIVSKPDQKNDRI